MTFACLAVAASLSFFVLQQYDSQQAQQMQLAGQQLPPGLAGAEMSLDAATLAAHQHMMNQQQVCVVPNSAQVVGSSCTAGQV